MKFKINVLTLLLFIFLATGFSFAQEVSLPSNQTAQELEEMYTMDDPTSNSPSLRAGPPVGPPIGGTPIGEAPIVAVIISAFAYIYLRKIKTSKEVI